MAGANTDKIADGVWRLAGDLGSVMNVYFVEEPGGGVTQFDAATKSMRKAILRAGEELGGIRRIVLGHAHADHRGTAPSVSRELGIPVLCHADEAADARRDKPHTYARFSELESWLARRAYPILFRLWDDGGVEIADTLAEGDRVGEFEVIHFPGHAPGQIGLWRERDRLAVVSDTVYFIDAVKMGKRLPEGEGVVPHHAFNWDHDQARASIRKLADLRPETVWAGHANALSGPGVVDSLRRAADA